MIFLIKHDYTLSISISLYLRTLSLLLKLGFTIRRCLGLELALWILVIWLVLLRQVIFLHVDIILFLVVLILHIVLILFIFLVLLLILFTLSLVLALPLLDCFLGLIYHDVIVLAREFCFVLVLLRLLVLGVVQVQVL